MKKDFIHLVGEDEHLHSDIKDYNFIIYSRIDELAITMSERKPEA